MATTGKLAISGASGQLGRRVLAHLLETHKISPSRIIAVTRKPDALADLAAQGAIVRAGSFDDGTALAKAFEGASRALLISTDKIDVPGARLKQHRAAVQAATDAGVKHAVYTSMMRPEPGSPIPFAPDHYGTEQALAASPLTWTVLRMCWYTDFLLQTLGGVIATGQLRSAAGEEGACYVTREDCARACAAALASDSTSNVKHDITGPSAVTHTELAKLLTELTDKRIEVIMLTPKQLETALTAAGLPAPIVALLVAIDVNTREGYVARVSNAVEKLTGKPPQSVRTFLTANKAALTP